MPYWRFQYRFIIKSCILLALTASCSHRQSALSREYLYAAIPEPGLILVYPMSATGSASPLARIKENPPDKPIDVSVDLVGEVFVANENGNIRVYAGRNFKYELVHTLKGAHTRIQHPISIVANLDGTFYVTDAGDGLGKPRVEWFSAGQNGNVFPNRVISGSHTQLTTPRGLALDGSGRLFVADRATNKVLVFEADADGDADPVFVLTGLRSPNHVFVDQLLNVYVSNEADNSVDVFISTGPRSWSRNRTITSRELRQPEGVVADQTGRIVVAATGGILFFGPNSEGDVEPVSELRGSSPMNPAGLAIH